MEQILDVIIKAPKTRAQNDDDFADRLSSRYTVVQLVAFAILVGLTQYVRTPMTCWAPVHFTGSHIKFTNNYCWVKNTYYLPWVEQVPKEWEENKRQMIPYYQWIPFVLLTQALLFYMPSVIWHGMNSKAGVDADSILVAARKLSVADTSSADDSTQKLVVNQIHRFLNTRRKRTEDGHSCAKDCFSYRGTACGRRGGSYLLILFLVSKIFYISNVIGQLLLLNSVLSAKYNTFGADIVRNMADNFDWTEESYVAFPRVTLCDFKIRGQDMTNVHPYTVQCVLPINLYNEKIYVFLWFWMVFVATVSVGSFLIWLMRSVIPLDRIRFIRTHVSERLDDHYIDYASKVDAINKFTNDYLQTDGVLLLRLIAHNVEGITTTEIASALFDEWVEQESMTSKALEAASESVSLT